jgi:PAS domain S-box-containing protein
MLGYTPEELKTLTYQDITPEKWSETENRIVREQVLVRGYSDTYEKEYIRKDGTVFPIELRTVLVKNDLGENEGMWAFVRDITERKKAEEELINSENSLRELNATKDKLFSILAHDLRNPFTAIQGYSNILANKVKEKNYDDTVKYAEMIQESTQRNLLLLGHIMDWARSRQKGQKFNPETLNIQAITRETAALLKDSAHQKKIILDLELPPRLSWKADKYMLGSVVRNLLSNAIKFTNPGGWIVVRATKSQNELKVSVSDNGIGISTEDQENLFQIEPSILNNGTLDEPGSGFGLLLCKEFIDKHGGRIWVESETGHGSTFHFTIPRL